MGSRFSFQHIGIAVVILLAAIATQVLPGRGAGPLQSDHTRTWRYVRVPHRAATPLERRLGDIASFVAERPVQVRCEDFSDGTLVEPGGVVEFNGITPADYARVRPDVCSALVHFMRSPTGASVCLARRT